MFRLPSALLALAYLLAAESPAHAEAAWYKYLNGNYITDMVLSGDTIWCATDGGLVKWNRTDGSHVHLTRDDGLLSNQLGAIDVDMKGAPWFSYENETLRASASSYSGGLFHTLDSTNSGFSNNRLRSVHFDKAGNQWFGFIRGGAVRFDGTSWTTFLPDKVLDKTPRKIVQTDDGVIWFATVEGVWTFDGEEWHNYTTADGLAGDGVNDIAIAPNGNLWFATLSGVSVFDGATWRNYTKKDGLINNNVNTLLIDSKGNTWFGTDFGVSMFNGAAWQSFYDDKDLIDNKVTDIVEDASHKIWFCHREAGRGVTVFDGSSWIWYTTWTEGTHLPSNAVYTMAVEKSGVIWYATEKGVARYDGASWKIFTTENGLKSTKITEIYIDDNNVKWFVYDRYDHNGITSFDDAEWKTYTVEDGIDSDSVTTVFRTDDGTLYFSTIFSLMTFNGVSWQKYPDSARLVSSDIFDIDSDTNGVMWFGTSKGLSRYDGVSWQTYFTNEPLLDDLTNIKAAPNGSVWGLSSFGNLVHLVDGALEQVTITTDESDTDHIWIEEFTIDNDSNIWAVLKSGSTFDETMGTWKCFLWRFDGSEWRRYCMTTDLPFDTVTSIKADELGDIWLATDRGLRRYNENGTDDFIIDGPISNNIRDLAIDLYNGKTMTTDRGLSFYNSANWRNIRGDSRRALAYDNRGVLWLTELYGIVTYDGSEWSLLEEVGDDSFYQSVTFTRDGDVMWVGTNMGLWRYGGGDDWIYYGEDKGGVINGIKDIAVDKNGILWMTVGIAYGVYSFDGADFVRYTSGDGLSYDRANVVVADKDNKKWVGTLRGLSCYNDTTWTSYFTKDGLPSDNITALAVDNNNMLWVGTDAGVARFDGATWDVFTDKDGLVDNTVQCIQVDYNNVVWIGTLHGLCAFDERGSIADVGKPSTIHLIGTYPNPFNIETTIEFDVFSWGDVMLDIYNISGQKVRSFSFPSMTAGRKKVVWNGRDDTGTIVSSGPYFFKVGRGGQNAKGRMMLVK